MRIIFPIALGLALGAAANVAGAQVDVRDILGGAKPRPDIPNDGKDIRDQARGPKPTYVPQAQSVLAGRLEISNPQPTLLLSDTTSQEQFALRFDGALRLSKVQLSAIGPSWVDVGTEILNLSREGRVGVNTSSVDHQLTIKVDPRLWWTSSRWLGALALENGAAIAWRANAAGQRAGFGHTNTGFYFFRTKSDPANTASPTDYDLQIDDSGHTIVRSLEITGGADLAERFDVFGIEGRKVAAPAPGMLVSIDPAHPGSLMISSRPHDRKVAGVVSGAGGVQPGVQLHQRASAAEGATPVALTGRTFCLADAAHGPIMPGDLLTTSATPGHAMKVRDPAGAQGAVVGKAMTKLERGKGLVLVLLALQ